MFFFPRRMALKTLNWISLEREVWMQFMMDVFCILWTFTTDTYKVRKNTSKMLKLAQQNHQSATLKQNLASCTCTLCACMPWLFSLVFIGKLRILLFPDHLRFFLLMKTQQGSLGCLYFPEESQSSVMISNHSPYLYIETSSFTVRDIRYGFSSS